MIDDTQLARTVSKGQAIVYHAIGHVENDFDEPAPPPEIRAVESRIVIDPSLAEGLEPGRRVMVISAGALVYVGASHLLPAVERAHRKYSILAPAAGVLVAVGIVLSKR